MGATGSGCCKHAEPQGVRESRKEAELSGRRGRSGLVRGGVVMGLAMASTTIGGQHRAAHISTGKIASGDYRSPIAEPSAFCRGRG